MFVKENELVPAVIQDSLTGEVLMLGYMNKESFQITLDSKLVTFYSRSRNTIWQKGESSGNILHVVEIHGDCDSDSILIKARPAGPTCHTGKASCFQNYPAILSTDFLHNLERIIEERKNDTNNPGYVNHIFGKGTHKIAQKVGEEGVEVVIEACRADVERFKEESADLIFHHLLLMNAMGVKLSEIVKILVERNKKNG